MTADPVALLRVAELLDDSPLELLNGGAAAALGALEESSPHVQGIAEARGIEPAVVTELWERANERLRNMPAADDVFAASAEAASLLYTAAWVLESDSATTEDVRAVL